MATPVPRLGCAAFYEGPILGKIRGFVPGLGRFSWQQQSGYGFRRPRNGQGFRGSKAGEFAARGAGAGRQDRKGTGAIARGGSETISGRGTPPQSGVAVRTARKRGGCHLPGVGEGADVLAAARSSSPDDYGKD